MTHRVRVLSADFTWETGQNHTGSMCWIINTPDGNVWVYYGDIVGTGVYTGTSGSGANMITAATTENRARRHSWGILPNTTPWPIF